MLKKLFVSVCFLCLQQMLMIAQSKPLTDADIWALIKKMSVEEKAGQMTQLDLGVIAKGDICKLTWPQSIDTLKLKLAIQKYHIGSILNVGCGSGTMSMAQWQSILSDVQFYNQKYSKNGVPIVYGIDAIHGVNYTQKGTLFPQQIAQAATWNPALIQSVYEATAYEMRATGLPWNFSPVLDIGRQPLWSRFFETFGEDVCLAKKMTASAVIGLQGSQNATDQFHVAACMKHFLGYSFSLSGHDRTPAWISDRELRTYFLPTFKKAIDLGAKTLMVNSGEINGVPVHVNAELLTQLLRHELGFTGVVVTDWEDIYKLVDIHKVAANKHEAVFKAINAGVDMSMTPNDFGYTEALIDLIKQGKLRLSRIDSSVFRVLKLKNDLGLFQVPLQQAYPKFGSSEHAALSYQVAAESVTLLKNTNQLLPLKSGQNLFVCGPSAHSLNALNGAWTHTWQGIDTTFNTQGKLTILQALQRKSFKVNYALDFQKAQQNGFKQYEKAIKQSNCIVICLAEQPSTEVPGNINDLTLPEDQIQLVKSLKQFGKPIVLVCSFNRPRIISAIEPDVAAIIYANLLSDEGGRVIADCIDGGINPSGKLPFTYPRYANDLVHYDRKHTEDLNIDFSMTAYNPQFDFGFGLSYTQFQYADLSVSNDTMHMAADSVLITVKIKNTGLRAGKEVVQLYKSDLVASVTPSVKQLHDFIKVELQPGQEKTISFKVYRKDLSLVNQSLKTVTEPGDFKFQIAQLSTSIYVQ